MDESGHATFIGGGFGTFNGLVAPQIARYDGFTYSVGSCLNGAVEAMMSFDDGRGEVCILARNNAYFCTLRAVTGAARPKSATRKPRSREHLRSWACSFPS